MKKYFLWRHVTQSWPTDHRQWPSGYEISIMPSSVQAKRQERSLRDLEGQSPGTGRAEWGKIAPQGHCVHHCVWSGIQPFCMRLPLPTPAHRLQRVRTRLTYWQMTLQDQFLCLIAWPSRASYIKNQKQLYRAMSPPPPPQSLPSLGIKGQSSTFQPPLQISPAYAKGKQTWLFNCSTFSGEILVLAFKKTLLIQLLVHSYGNRAHPSACCWWMPPPRAGHRSKFQLTNAKWKLRSVQAAWVVWGYGGHGVQPW